MKQSNVPARDLEQAAYGAIWSSDITQGLSASLCRDIGERPMGSTGMEKASDILLSLFESLGLENVHSEPVDAIVWERGDCRLSLAGCGADIPAVQFSMTPSACVEARLVDAGCGMLSECRQSLDGRAGAIAVIRDQLPSGVSYPVSDRSFTNAIESGASAIIVVRGSAGGSPLHGSAATPDVFGIPIVGVSSEDGACLLAACSRGAGASLVSTCRFRRGSCRNVVAEFGSRDDAEGGIYVLSAHLDSLPGTTGARDNASGVCTLVEIAAALSPLSHRLTKRWRVVAFTGEEDGFHGSASYVSDHADELPSIRFVLNFDEIFDQTAKGLAVHWAPEIVPYLTRMAASSGRSLQVADYLSLSSDYLAFGLRGIPTARPADFSGAPNPWAHTSEDSLEKLDPDVIKLNATVFAGLVLRMSLDAEPFPGRRRDPGEVRDELARWKVLDFVRREPSLNRLMSDYCG